MEVRHSRENTVRQRDSMQVEWTTGGRLLISRLVEMRTWEGYSGLTFSFCSITRFLAWPKMPKPVTSVAACALYLCISLAPVRLSLLHRKRSCFRRNARALESDTASKGT